MGVSLQALCAARSAAGRDPASPAVGRAIVSAIKACAQSSYGALYASLAVERALAESVSFFVFFCSASRRERDKEREGGGGRRRKT